MSIEAETPRESVAPPRQSPRTPRLRNALPLVLAVLLLAELSIRAAASWLPDPLLWASWEAQNKVAAMEALGKQGGASVVFVGSSMVNRGFDPTLATKLLGGKRPAFNAAVSGSDVRTDDVWTRKVVVPLLHPDVVVVGFNSGEMNTNWDSSSQLYARFVDSPFGKRISGRGGFLARADAWMIEHSYLMRYRSVLREPIDAVLGRDDKDEAAQAVDRLGTLRTGPNFAKRRYTTGLSVSLAVWNDMFHNYSPGGKQAVALDRLVSELTAKGIRVVIVRMPVTKDIVPLHPNGQADRDRFTRFLAAFVAAHPVRFINAEEAIGGDTALFLDPVHMNAEGQRRTTTFVAGLLKRPA